MGKNMGESKVNDAVACFEDGFNCSQSIFSTYCEEFGVDKKTAFKIACGFGAGMGRLQETCGAVTGAFMLIGLKYGMFLKGDTPAKEKTYAKVREFAELFTERNKTVNCRELLGGSLLDGDPRAPEQVKIVCPKVIREAAEIIEQIIWE
jgi:C_GCAxxG_C_C family probable redox protein